MIIFGAPLLATKWFEDSKRDIVISFTYTVTFLAADHSFGFNTLILDNIEEGQGKNRRKALLVLFSIKAALSLFTLIVTYFTFRSKPKLPPSEAATVYRDDDILGTIRQLYSNKQFRLLAFTHILYIIAFNIMRRNLNEMIKIYHPSLSNNDNDNLKLCLTTGAVLGSISLGIFLYLTKFYKTANV